MFAAAYTANLIFNSKSMIKENICIWLAVAGVVAVLVSAALCSGIVFVCGMATIMGGMATLA